MTRKSLAELVSHCLDCTRESGGSVSADHEVDALLLGFPGGAYLCVFGGLITATNPQLQTAQRNEHGGLTSSVLELIEKKARQAILVTTKIWIWEQ